MGRVKRPSFLKRQKEQRRAAKAAEKREQRIRKKQARADGTEELDSDIVYLNPDTGMPFAQDEEIPEEILKRGPGETP